MYRIKIEFFGEIVADQRVIFIENGTTMDWKRNVQSTRDRNGDSDGEIKTIYIFFNVFRLILKPSLHSFERCYHIDRSLSSSTAFLLIVSSHIIFHRVISSRSQSTQLGRLPFVRLNTVQQIGICPTSYVPTISVVYIACVRKR